MINAHNSQTATDLDRLQSAVQHFQTAQYTDAMALLESIPTTSMYYFDASHLKGTICYQLQHYDEAIVLLENANEIKKDNAQLLNTLASCFLAKGNYETAVKTYKKSLEIDPQYDQAKNNLCRALFLLVDNLITGNNPKQAIERLDELVKIDNANVSAMLQRAFLLQETGDFFAANKAYDQALLLLGSSDQQHVDIRTIREAKDQKSVLISKAIYNRAIARLTMGDYGQAWSGYRARPSLATSSYSVFQERLPDDLSDKKLLVIHDQGLGDEVFFLRYIDELLKRGGETQYYPHPKLRTLLEQCSDIELAADTKGSYDYVLSVCDLPFVLDINEPRKRPLKLTPDSGRLSEIEKQLQSFGPPPYVGISWRGGTENPDNSLATSIRKSIPLESLTEAFSDFNGTLCILQRNPHPSELERLKTLNHCTIADCSEFNEELTDMLCLLDRLDDYIGVSNTNTHLNGSLCKTGGVLVPFPPEWRWGLSGNKSDWYSEIEVCRQTNESWDASVADIKQRINKLVPHG